jgi:hypothetical protein
MTPSSRSRTRIERPRSVIEAKLAIPALRRGLVARARVQRALDRPDESRRAFGGELVVVLDSLQSVRSDESLASLEHAIAHLPPNDGLTTFNGLESCGRNDVPGRQRLTRHPRIRVRKFYTVGIGRRARPGLSRPRLVRT